MDKKHPVFKPPSPAKPAASVSSAKPSGMKVDVSSKATGTTQPSSPSASKSPKLYSYPSPSSSSTTTSSPKIPPTNSISSPKSTSAAPSIFSPGPLKLSGGISKSPASPTTPKSTLGQTKPPTTMQKSRSEPTIPKHTSVVKASASAKTPPSLPKFASALDVKRQAAQHDPAWQGRGQEEGLVIWRIEKFLVKEIPKSSYGRFFNGDSYILLNTYRKRPNAGGLSHDVHFWLGSKTTQDESGTAAYKTVELDDYLGGMAVQHREVEGHESDLFLSYFPVPIVIMEGGIESGFVSVKNLGQEYKPRLLQLKGKRQVRIVQVPLSCKSLNGGDAFVLDAGLTLYQFNGNLASGTEKHKASTLCRALVDERKSEPQIIVYHEGEKGIANEFWALLGGKSEISTASQGGDDEDFERNCKLKKRLFKLSDESGTLQFTQIAEGTIKRSMLKSEDAFIFDSGTEVFAWIGLRTSEQERRSSLKYAQDYLKQYNRPAHMPVCRIMEGGENNYFESAFDSK